jgi:hypothetical protein
VARRRSRRRDGIVSLRHPLRGAALRAGATAVYRADHRFERGFVFFACALALFALITGYRRHQRALPLMLAIPGLLLLIFGVTWAEGISIIVHSVLVTIGGLLVASSHFINLRSDRRRSHAGHVHGPQCAH